MICKAKLTRFLEPHIHISKKSHLYRRLLRSATRFKNTTGVRMKMRHFITARACDIFEAARAFEILDICDFIYLPSSCFSSPNHASRLSQLLSVSVCLHLHFQIPQRDPNRFWPLAALVLRAC